MTRAGGQNGAVMIAPINSAIAAALVIIFGMIVIFGLAVDIKFAAGPAKPPARCSEKLTADLLTPAMVHVILVLPDRPIIPQKCF
ncbi:MAG: hypothetical protein BroJett033_5140 [Chloroflexota bacterium]|nr:MAG: hypothetical protein BroJett033_5140 [Chloroflexota bacterium]